MTLALTAAALGGADRCRATTLAGILDQSFPAITNYQTAYGFGTFRGVNWELAQTFKVGISGTFSGVNLQLGQMLALGSSNLTADVTVSLRTVSGGFPATGLASATLPASAIPRSPFNAAIWVPVDFSAANLSVTAGQSLAVTVSSLQTQVGEDGYGWVGIVAGGYADGSAEFRRPGYPWSLLSEADLGFQDYVIPVAEPGISGLFVAGLFLLIGRGSSLLRRKREGE